MSGPRLTTGPLLARNSFLNLATGGGILLLNVLFVPAMLRSFGMELYGVLAVTWMVLGHLRWLDLGFSAACAKYVAEDLEMGRPGHARLWAWTAVSVQLVIGVLAAIGLWLVAPLLAELLRVGPEQRELVVLALRLFAVVVPLDLATRSFAAVLEGAQRFDWVNGLNAFAALWTYGAYAAGILRGGDFYVVIYLLVALKAAQLAATFFAAARVVPQLRSLARDRLGSLVSRERVLSMLRFGGWVSVSAAIGPVLLFYDRWVVSSLEGVAVLPYYAVPFGVLWAISILPGSLSATLFPAFSAMEARIQWERVEHFFARSHRYLLIGVLPILFVLFVWAPELLRVWIDADFSARATLPFRVLVLGFSFGLFAPISGVLLQGAGRPDILTKIYMVELPLNLVIIYLLVREWGILGAAVGYSARTSIEVVVLWIAIYRTFPLSWARCAREILHRTGVVLAAMVALSWLLRGSRLDDALAVAATLTVLAAYALLVHRYLLEEVDRALFRRLLRRS